MSGDDGVVKLVDVSENMKHYSVVQMLEEVLADVKENPEAFQNAYLIMRCNQPDGSWDHHHIRAGFTDDISSLGYLKIAEDMRSTTIRRGLFQQD